MKKIISFILCLVLVCMTLASCKGDEYGYKGDYDGYITNEERSPIVLDFCIVTDSRTEDNAKKTVAANINQYLRGKFNTTLNIRYMSADNYAAEVLAAAQGTDGENTYRADIVLILGEEMFDSLHSLDLLVDLSNYYDPENYHKYDSEAFARLNTIMSTKNLISASYVGDKIYTVPNDHVIGAYEFILVNTDIVEKYYNYSCEKISTWLDYDCEELVALREKIAADGVYSVDDAIKHVTDGEYADIEEWASEGYICNIVKYPEVTRAEAFKSAFAIIKDAEHTGEIPEGTLPAYLERYFRAMEVIYTISSDVTLATYLQFGIQGPNYTVKSLGEYDNTVRNDSGTGQYFMNPLYTGSIFNMNFCEELGWTPTVKANALAQNKHSILPGV